MTISLPARRLASSFLAAVAAFAFATAFAAATASAQTTATIDATASDVSISTNYTTNGGLALDLGFFADYLIVGGGGGGGGAGWTDGVGTAGGGGAGGVVLSGNAFRIIRPRTLSPLEPVAVAPLHKQRPAPGKFVVRGVLGRRRRPRCRPESAGGHRDLRRRRSAAVPKTSAATATGRQTPTAAEPAAQVWPITLPGCR